MQQQKQQMFEAFAMVAKALGSSHRLELLELLAQSERSVEALSELSALNFANCSQHLQNLRRAGLVSSRRAGKRVIYSLADDQLITLLSALRHISIRNFASAERAARDYFDARDSMEAISRDELVERMKKDEITVLDVRPIEEFAAGHLPGAINISLAELETRLGDLPANQEIVAYCRGPYCVMSFEAVALLRQNGFEARRLEDGFPEWKIADLGVEMH